MSGISFVITGEIGTSSTVVREFGTVTSFAGAGDLGVRASIAVTADLGVGESLEDIWKTWAETPLADVCRIGIETSLGGVRGLGIGAKSSFNGEWKTPPYVMTMAFVLRFCISRTLTSYVSGTSGLAGKLV